MSIVTLGELISAQPELAVKIGILPKSTVKPISEVTKSAYTKGRELVADRVWTQADITKRGSFVVYLDHAVHREEERGFHDAVGIDLLLVDMPSAVVTHPELGSRLLKITTIYDDAGIPFASQYSVEVLPDPTGL